MNTRKTKGAASTSKSKAGAKGKSTTSKSPKKTFKKTENQEFKPRDKKPFVKFQDREKKGDPMPKFNENEMRLNKFLSNAGVASRRDADVLIQSGVVSVNNIIITEMGHKIKPGDIVKYDGETISADKKRYVLLNKPKGFITTTDDPLGRKTVMSLVYKACKEVIYPIGRLERDTTGLMLFTNDGDLAKKLIHPQYKATKIFHVETDKPVTVEDIEKMRAGIHLDDGKVVCEKVEYVKNGTSREVGVELNSNKNKVVIRMFEALEYKVVKLDRVKYAGLTKKDLPRGFYRHLTEKEVAFLKMS